MRSFLTMFHIRESRTGPDNVLNSKLRWLQNLKRHLNIDTQHELWIWLDLICVPQANRENQKKAIASLCYYANLCSRFIPLVRDKNEWIELYGEHENACLPKGTLEVRARRALKMRSRITRFYRVRAQVYLSRGWCRLEIIAALCPKRFKSSGLFRPGPLNIKFRFHHDPESAGAGPRLTVNHLLNPRTADFTNDADRQIIEPVLYRIAQEYAAYEESGSKVWDQTIDVRQRPAWMREILNVEEQSTCASALRGRARYSTSKELTSTLVEVIPTNATVAETYRAQLDLPATPPAALPRSPGVAPVEGGTGPVSGRELGSSASDV